MNILFSSPVIGDDFFPQTCIINYTTFINNDFNRDNNTIVEIYNEQSSYCANKCNNLTNCTSFSFEPSTLYDSSVCTLTNIPYKSLHIYYKFSSVYYLKSLNVCDLHDDNNLWMLYLFANLIIIFLCLCWLCCMINK